MGVAAFLLWLEDPDESWDSVMYLYTWYTERQLFPFTLTPYLGRKIA